MKLAGSIRVPGCHLVILKFRRTCYGHRSGSPDRRHHQRTIAPAIPAALFCQSTLTDLIP
jgi:hypothetical protein